MFENTAECSRCGKDFPCSNPLSICDRCGGAILLRYDLDKISEKVSKDALSRRRDSFWKFLEFLPLLSSKSIVSLGEPYTPILQLTSIDGNRFKNLFVKDEGRLPTGTFKARGMAVAVSKLKELGIKRVAIPSAGNAASALAAYGSKAGMEVYAFMPKDVPDAILKESVHLGAKVYLVDGLISHAAKIVEKLKEKYEWFNLSTNKQPYRFEGYKAMAYEIAEQFDWNPPENIFFPTGGGEGIIGLWKGFKEMIDLGWIEKIPRLILVQSSGCAPLVKAYNDGELEVKEPWKNARTIAAGLRVPYPYASYLILRALKETNGVAVEVSDEEIVSSMKTFLKNGIYACPEAASTLAALERIRENGMLDIDERILLCVTGNVIKYFDLLRLEKNKIPLLSKDADSLGQNRLD
ncbi:threonine synthase [Candidatus Bathyarchaeota archaeon]|nr:MAG: threonine synthase [Candidatus Bathyarchaeota archaeon]